VEWLKITVMIIKYWDHELIQKILSINEIFHLKYFTATSLRDTSKLFAPYQSKGIDLSNQPET